MGNYHDKLNEDERARNTEGVINVYTGRYSPLGRKLSLNPNSEQMVLLYNEHNMEGQIVLIRESKEVL